MLHVLRELGKSEEHLPLTTVLLAKSGWWTFIISSPTLELIKQFQY